MVRCRRLKKGKHVAARDKFLNNATGVHAKGSKPDNVGMAESAMEGWRDNPFG